MSGDLVRREEGLRAEVERVVARMESRQVDHRHEDETGYWGVRGRAYFYAGDVYDDYADLHAALDRSTAADDEGLRAQVEAERARHWQQNGDYRDGYRQVCSVCSVQRSEPFYNPFRYCPVKGCGWHEGMTALAAEPDPAASS
jgi:hypothetical protein